MAAASKKLYAMKEACEQTGLPYETLKYYCNTGLVPNVKRLDKKRSLLQEKLQEIQESIDYIDWKQNFYDEVTSGKRVYTSDLLPEYNDDDPGDE